MLLPQMLVSLLLERGDSILMEEYSYPHMLVREGALAVAEFLQ